MKKGKIYAEINKICIPRHKILKLNICVEWKDKHGYYPDCNDSVQSLVEKAMENRNDAEIFDSVYSERYCAEDNEVAMTERPNIFSCDHLTKSRV